jgi:D-alanyl-D-alanine carboxypeptidase (penicillin-binding protein 5/6)
MPVMVAPFDLEALLELEPVPAAPEPPRRRVRTSAPTTSVPTTSASVLLPPASAVALSPTSASGSVQTLTRRERRSRQRFVGAGAPRLPWWRLSIVSVVIVLLATVVIAGVRLNAAIPAAVVTPNLHGSLRVGGSAQALPWPATGQSAIAVPSVGIDVASGPEQAAPIASLTKMMTAYVILADHPLSGSQSGPRIAMTQVDVDDFNNDTVEDQANAQVSVGEVLSERQLLGGLLVHSANNYADTLARWDAGSIPAFVAKMNQAARLLHMEQTHYADPSGFDAGSQSTPADLLKVAAPDMTNPVFASLVKMPSITLPLAGTISSYTPLLGVEGTIGVKSGFTQQAGGCDVLAVVRRVHGLPVLILGAVTGQQGPNVLNVAATMALTLADAVGGVIGATPVIRSGVVVAHVSAGGHTVEAAVSGSAQVLSWPGITVNKVFTRHGTIKPGAKAGTQVGTLTVTTGTQVVTLPVRLTRPLPKLSLTQRLF